MPKKNTDTGFEESLAALESVVKALESGDVTLDEIVPSCLTKQNKK